MISRIVVSGISGACGGAIGWLLWYAVVRPLSVDTLAAGCIGGFVGGAVGQVIRLKR